MTKQEVEWYAQMWASKESRAESAPQLDSLAAEFARQIEAEVPSALMIKQESKHKFVLYSKKASKALGVHPSKEKAMKQEQAIEISKHAGEKGATKPRRSK